MRKRPKPFFAILVMLSLTLISANIISYNFFDRIIFRTKYNNAKLRDGIGEGYYKKVPHHIFISNKYIYIEDNDSILNQFKKDAAFIRRYPNCTDNYGNRFGTQHSYAVSDDHVLEYCLNVFDENDARIFIYTSNAKFLKSFKWKRGDIIYSLQDDLSFTYYLNPYRNEKDFEKEDVNITIYKCNSSDDYENNKCIEYLKITKQKTNYTIIQGINKYSFNWHSTRTPEDIKIVDNNIIAIQQSYLDHLFLYLIDKNGKVLYKYEFPIGCAYLTTSVNPNNISKIYYGCDNYKTFEIHEISIEKK